MKTNKEQPIISVLRAAARWVGERKGTAINGVLFFGALVDMALGNPTTHDLFLNAFLIKESIHCFIAFHEAEQSDFNPKANKGKLFDKIIVASSVAMLPAGLALLSNEHSLGILAFGASVAGVAWVGGLNKAAEIYDEISNGKRPSQAITADKLKPPTP